MIPKGNRLMCIHGTKRMPFCLLIYGRRCKNDLSSDHQYTKFEICELLIIMGHVVPFMVWHEYRQIQGKDRRMLVRPTLTRVLQTPFSRNPPARGVNMESGEGRLITTESCRSPPAADLCQKRRSRRAVSAVANPPFAFVGESLRSCVAS